MVVAPEVVEALFDAGLPVAEDEEEPVRAAVLTVVFAAKTVPFPPTRVPTMPAVPAVPAVPGMIPTVVDAVPLAESVTLEDADTDAIGATVAVPLALELEADAEAEADALAPWTSKGPK